MATVVRRSPGWEQISHQGNGSDGSHKSNPSRPPIQHTLEKARRRVGFHPFSNREAFVHEITYDFAEAGSRESILLACFHSYLGHDLRNDFLIVHDHVQQILANLGTEAPDQVRGLVEQLADQVHLTSQDVDLLATLGKLIRDSEPLTTVDLADLCREAAAEARWLSNDPPVDYHISDQLPVTPVFTRLVKAVLVQVLRNAFAAGLPERPLRVDINGEIQGEDVVLHVRDNGRGLSLSQVQRLTYLLAHGTIGSHRMGRGLFLVRQMLAANGGAIRICSTQGEGTTVSMTFRRR
jgi:signal transduction histidine kinase